MRGNTTLGDIARATGGSILRGAAMQPVADLSHDSRQIGPAWLFVAIRGFELDGHKFLDQVLAQGAAGVISELDAPDEFAASWLKVDNARAAMARAAAEINDHPSRKLKLVAITGTNGKTTSAYVVAALAAAAGQLSAMMTTVETRVVNERRKAVRTTPEAPDGQRLLAKAVDLGCQCAVMEFSSQAMDLHRCDDLQVEAAVFTNLTRDHLDYHGTMERYYDAKKYLFDGRLGQRPRASIVNVDDAYGVRLVHELSKDGVRASTFALDTKADLVARNINVTLAGMRFKLDSPAGTVEVVTPLVGRPHVYNILGSIGAGLQLGLSLDVMLAGLRTCSGAPGRFERVPHAGDFTVVVDYAHTDDALVNILRSARGLTKGRIITMFGCGGDRDRSKRAPMGAAAAAHSDLVFLTSDNPRTEDPARIFADAEAGLKGSATPYFVVPDRREAIHRAIEEAGPGDLVVIAGKGHEDYQIIGHETFHFDDREVANEALVQ